MFQLFDTLLGPWPPGSPREVGIVINCFSEVWPKNSPVAGKMVVQVLLYTMADGILYCTGQKKDSVPKIVILSEYKKSVMEEYQSGIMSSYFTCPRVYKALSCQLWWDHMDQDIINYVYNCPQNVIETDV